MALKEVNYRKELTSALRAYVDGHETNMYSQVTNAIYKAVFRENAKEYRAPPARPRTHFSPPMAAVYTVGVA